MLYHRPTGRPAASSSLLKLSNMAWTIALGTSPQNCSILRFAETDSWNPENSVIVVYLIDAIIRAAMRPLACYMQTPAVRLEAVAIFKYIIIKFKFIFS